MSGSAPDPSSLRSAIALSTDDLDAVNHASWFAAQSLNVPAPPALR
jgi:hypothetical protein